MAADGARWRSSATLLGLLRNGTIPLHNGIETSGINNVIGKGQFGDLDEMGWIIPGDNKISTL